MIRLPLLLLILPALMVLPAQAVFKCVDEKGVTHYGDTMPPQCASKPVSQMSSQGSLIKKIDAPQTPEQIKAKAEADAKRKLEEKQIADLKRTDFALIATYGAEKEFDEARDRDLAQMDARMIGLKDELNEANARVLKVNRSLDSYKPAKNSTAPAHPVPPLLIQQQTDAVRDRENANAQLTALNKERDAISAKYNNSKQRWKLLKQGMPAGTLSPATAATDNAAVVKPSVVPTDAAGTIKPKSSAALPTLTTPTAPKK